MRNQEERNPVVDRHSGYAGRAEGSLNPGNFRRCTLAMQQGDDDRTYPYPLPRNSGEWQRLLRNIGREAFGDYATMTAAGLAFYSLLGIVPVLIALATLYGLVANPAAVQRLVEELRGFVTTQAANVLAGSLKSSGRDFGFGIGFAVSLGFVLWTAQWASSGLITALNIVFDAGEQHAAGCLS